MILLMIHVLEYVFQIKKKKMNVKVSNLMSEANETRFLVQYEFGEWECGLNESVYNSKQK